MGYLPPQKSTQPIRGFTSRVHAYLGVNQNIPNAANTVVQLNTVGFDGLGEWDTAAYRFTPTKAGYYAVLCQSYWDDWAGGGWGHSLWIQTDDATFIRLTNGWSMVNAENSDVVTGICYFDPTHWYEVRVVQVSGVVQTLLNGSFLTFLDIHRLS